MTLIRNKRVFTTIFDLISTGTGISLVTNDDKVKSLIAGTNVFITDNGDGTVTISTDADDIIVVANYSALPTPGTVTGQFYWCSNSQGTSWLPGSLGGTYYNKGLYYSNGVSWEYLDTPYQATQAEVNTGTNTDKFVTPATLSSWTTLTTFFKQLGNAFGLDATLGTIDNFNLKFITNNILRFTISDAGKLISSDLAGSSDRAVQVSSTGEMSATKEFISAYISAGTTATNLENTSNWSLVGVYTGTAITGTYQGQKHYNADYLFECVADNVWIRLIRG